jgi:hypothetical protein
MAYARELILQHAKFWGVAERNVREWVTKKAPLNSSVGMVQWFKNQQPSRSPSVRKKLRDKDLLSLLRVITGEVGPMEPETAPVDAPDGEARDLETAKLYKLRLEIKLKALELEQEQGALISRAEVRESHQVVGSLFSTELEAMLGDMPGQLAGLDEAGVKTRLKARIVALLLSLNSRLKELAEV